MEAAAELSQLFHGDGFLPICSDQGDRSIDADTRNVRYIYHKLVHADTSQDRGTLSADQHIAAIGQTSRVSVPVAHRHSGDPHGALCHIGAAIADLFTRPDLLYIGNKGF